MSGEYRLLPAGEQGLVVELGNEISPAVNRRVRDLAWRLSEQNLPGLREMVPTYRSLLILYDPLTLSLEKLAEVVAAGALAQTGLPAPEPMVTVLPTCYGGEYGPDLAAVSAHTGLSPENVIAQHTGQDYLIYMLGFTPGFPYLGGMPGSLATPRLSSPRTKIPAGSVGIAGAQTGVYPVESPGGWQLIGRTPLPLYDPAATPPVRLQAGDYVRFTAINAEEYQTLSAAQAVSAPPVSTAAVEETVAEIISPGLLTTIQDRGRHGYLAYGVPVAGAMDDYAFRLGNRLVGNDPGAAGLEITLTGPVLRFTVPTVFAITGADLGPCLNDKSIPAWTAIEAAAGDTLSFIGRNSGCRAYLSIAGGITVPPVMGSRSTYLRAHLGGLQGRALVAGDRIPGRSVPEARAIAGCRVPAETIPAYPTATELRVLLGPQDDCFPPESIATFLGSEYTVTSGSDGLGYRLAGPALTHKTGADIISDGLPLGAIQVPGHGSPIIMLADRQTTGGYTKLACVITPDLPRLAQLLPGDRVRFSQVDYPTAVQALREYEARINCRLETGLTPVAHWRLGVDGRSYEVIVEERK